MYSHQIDQSILDFELKKHTLQRYLQQKKDEINLCEKNLALQPTCLQDEDSILRLLSEVKNNMKTIELMFHELKTIFYDLDLSFIHEFFHQMMYCLIQAIMLLSNSCQKGIHKSLLKFTKDTQDKSNLKNTICTQLTNQQILRQLEESNRKPNDFYSDVRTKMQIQRIYSTLVIDKHSIEGIVSSGACNKLGQIQQSMNQLIKQTDKIIEQGIKLRKDPRHNEPNSHIYNSEQMNKIFKAQLSDGIKNSFKKNMEKITNKMHKDFYKKQFNKLRDQILKLKTKTNSTETQTDGEPKPKQIICNRDKKTIDRLQKQLRDTEAQKDEIIDKYLKIMKKREFQIEETGTKMKRKQSISVRFGNNKNQRIEKPRTKRESIAQKLLIEQNNTGSRPISKQQNNTQSRINIQFLQQKSIKKQRNQKRTHRVKITKTPFYSKNNQIEKSRFINQNLINKNKEIQYQSLSENSGRTSSLNLQNSAITKQIDLKDQNNSQSILSDHQNTNNLNKSMRISLEICKQKSSGYQQKYKQIIESIVGLIKKQKKIDKSQIHQNMELQGLFEQTVAHIINDPTSKIQLVNQAQQQPQRQQQKYGKYNGHTNQLIDDKNQVQILKKSGQKSMESQLHQNFNIIFKVFNNINDKNVTKTNQKQGNPKNKLNEKPYLTKNSKNKPNLSKQNSICIYQQPLTNNNIVNSINSRKFKPNQYQNIPQSLFATTCQDHRSKLKRYHRFDKFNGDLDKLKKIKDVKYKDKKIYTEPNTLNCPSIEYRSEVMNKNVNQKNQKNINKNNGNSLIKINSFDRNNKSNQQSLQCRYNSITRQLLNIIKEETFSKQIHNLQNIRDKFQRTLQNQLTTKI